MSKHEKTFGEGSWTISFTLDQVDVLRLVLASARADMTHFNKDWLPAKIARVQIDNIISVINDTTG